MKQAVKWLDQNIELCILSVLLCMIACTMLVQVICRYCLNSALSWPEELSCYMHIWYCFIGLSYATKKKIHLRVDTFLNIMPARVRNILEGVTSLSLLVFMVYMILAGIQVESTLMTNGQVSPAMRIPMWTVNLSLMAGCVLSVIRIGQAAFNKIKFGKGVA